ncbi:unnamed protein product [Adineta ricciae]|uniref:Uncharacterized protein n=1 Tax=Adineta ricciae TaxID=249248 RepID=A0A815R5W6_ADIRI|nr:unnamed protein product [Adineta ricciae]
MDKKQACSNSEACLQFIYSKFDSYKQVLDDEQHACEKLIASIREQICLYDNDDEKLRAMTGFNAIELANQLAYFEQEAFKTHEENKTCLFKMFQKLLSFNRDHSFNEVLLNERQIADLFQYRPSVLPNIKRIAFLKHSNSLLQSNPMMQHTDPSRLIFPEAPKVSIQSTTFSKRADIEAFQQKQGSIRTRIESNEIDLTQLIRDTVPITSKSQFNFAKVSQHFQRQQNFTTAPRKKISKPTVPCNDALLTAANKRFILLYNMNTPKLLYFFDTQKDETKEFPWDEDVILSLGHVDGSLFYIITATKIFLFDIIKENFDRQYFLYDTLYKDLLLLTTNSSYQTAIKCNNQIQSITFDDFCYYLYTTKDYEQLLIKCSVENFYHEASVNLTRHYPDIQYFLGFTVTSKGLITFLIQDNHGFHLYFCDESRNYDLIKKLSVRDALEPTKIVTTFLSNLQLRGSTANKSKSGKQVWFVLDRQSNCVHCLIRENYLTKINSPTENFIQSVTIFDTKLILAYSELSVDIIDLDSHFSSL